jgi:phosphate transport system protein
MTLHTDREYEADLQALRQQFLRIGGLVEQMIGNALQATFDRNETLALAVAESDKEVNRSELEIDELCLKVLALRQPAASDLRFVTFALKAITDLERIGDLAVNVADRAAELSREPPLQLYPELGRMAELAKSMLHDALDAFVNRDAVAADGILTRDDQVDELYWTFFRQLLVVMQNDRTAVERAIRLLFVAKHIERLADHVTNLAELVVFMVRGQDIRHPRSRLPEEATG